MKLWCRNFRNNASARPSRSGFFWLVCLAFACVFAASAQAERLTVYGVPFEVEQLSPVDETGVKVSLFGDSTIVPKNRLEDYVLSAYFQKEHASELPPALLQKFILGALKAHDGKMAEKAFRALLTSQPMDEAGLIEFVGILNGAEGGLALMKSAISEADEVKAVPNALAKMLFYVGLQDAQWVRMRGLRYIYVFAKEVRQCFDEGFLSALQDSDLALMRRIVKVEGTVFGVDDSLYEMHRVAGDKIQQSIESLARGETEGLYPLRDLSRKDSRLAPALNQIVVKAVHAQAEKSLAAGDGSKAMQVLSLISPELRTPTTHDLLKRALDYLAGSQDNVFEDAGALDFAAFLAEKDDDIKRSFVSLLESQAALLAVRQCGTKASILQRIIQLRPDPNAGNDRVRVLEALGCARKGMYTEARAKLREIKTGISFGDRIRILAAGVYISPWLIVLLAMVCFAGLVFVVLMPKLRTRLAAVRQRLDAADWAAQHEEETDSSLPLFSKLGRGLSPKHTEYAGYLRQLGLEPGASLKAVKTAYRNAVKGVHPDRSTEVNAADSESFIQLTNTYERILALRKELGIVD